MSLFGKLFGKSSGDKPIKVTDINKFKKQDLERLFQTLFINKENKKYVQIASTEEKSDTIPLTQISKRYATPVILVKNQQEKTALIFSFYGKYVCFMIVKDGKPIYPEYPNSIDEISELFNVRILNLNNSADDILGNANYSFQTKLLLSAPIRIKASDTLYLDVMLDDEYKATFELFNTETNEKTVGTINLV